VLAIIGKENIRARFKKILEAADYEITDVGEPIIEVIDSIAYEFRTVTIATFPKDGSDKMLADLKTLSILKKQADGSWKAYIDCVNFHPTWSMDTIPEGMREENPYY
jgi:ketosteroid isomerase-like protein